jgi:quinol monooxygenase YgiN
MSKAPFGIIIEAKLKPGTTLAAREAATKLLAAMKSNEAATKFWGYSTGTGEGEHIVVFAPFQKYSDLDRPSTGEIAGKAAAKDVDGLLTAIDSSVAKIKRSIVEYVPALSNPPDHDAPAPGPNVYHVKVKLKPGNTIKARELAAKIAEAYRKSAKGMKYWGYGTALGENETYHLMIPFEKYADLDGWTSTAAVLNEAKANTDAVLTEIDGLIEHSERSILTYVPGLSNPA